MEKVTIVNASEQKVSLWVGEDMLSVLRKQADAGEIQLQVGEPEPKRSPRKKAASRED